MPKMIRCPHHEDSTASLAIYEDGSEHCYGCGHHAKSNGVHTHIPKEREDVEASLRHILTLPTRTIRGLDLPYDSSGYYIVWHHSHPHYKLRRWSEDAPKYIGPKGVRAPLFWAAPPSHRSLIIIEGELNALSLHELVYGYDIVSPGSAGDFYSNKSADLLTMARLYDKVYIVVDEDAAGWAAAVKLHMKLPQSQVKFMKPDINETLVTHGQEEAANIVKNTLGL